MSIVTRKLFFRALAVVVLGGAALLFIPPPAAATVCTFCTPQCPTDVAQWCSDAGCYGSFPTCNPGACTDFEDQVVCGQF